MAKKLIVIAVVAIMLFGVFGLAGCTESLDEYKAAGKEQIKAHAATKTQIDYSSDNWSALLLEVTKGKAAIDKATNKAQVDTAIEKAKQAINAIEIKENKVNPISIHFFTTENWIHWQDHKYYDFVNMTYSTKRILVEFYEGKPIPVLDEEYKIVAIFTEDQLRTFFDSIRESGIFDLDEYYHENTEDGDTWNLIITFNDGTVYESKGYVKYPPQKDAIDEGFLALTGFKLFSSLLKDN